MTETPERLPETARLRLEPFTLADFEVWALRERRPPASPQAPMAGWAGLLHTGLSDLHGGPELQYMLAGHAQGKGYATEAAGEVLHDAASRHPGERVIAVVDIPNTASIRVLEKLGFRKERQIEAYGSPEMYLFSRELRGSRTR